MIAAAALAAAVAASPAAAQEGGSDGGGPRRAPAGPDSLPTYASADGRVYLTRDEALVEIYPDVERVRAERWTLSDREVRRIEEGSGVEVPDRRPVVYRVLGADDALLGYAMILEERGKYRPITMMVGVSPDVTVHGVEVMVYREDRGEEVRYGRFLRQYRDKGTGAPIRTHRDIMNVTGATISVHSMNDGVRRCLHTVKLLYGEGGRAPGSVAGPAGGGDGEPAATGDDGKPALLAQWRPAGSR